MNDSSENREDLETIFDDMRKRQRRSMMLSRMLAVYQYVGLLVTLFGLLLFVFDLTKVVLTFDQKLYLIFISVGLLLSLGSFVTIRVIRTQKRDDFELRSRLQKSMDFIFEWMLLEESLRETMGEIGRERPIREVLAALREKGALTDKDVALITQLSIARNEVIHLRRTLSDSEVEIYIGAIENLSKRLAAQVW